MVFKKWIKKSNSLILVLFCWEWCKKVGVLDFFMLGVRFYGRCTFKSSSCTFKDRYDAFLKVEIGPLF